MNEKRIREIVQKLDWHNALLKIENGAFAKIVSVTYNGIVFQKNDDNRNDFEEVFFMDGENDSTKDTILKTQEKLNKEINKIKI